MRIVTIGIAAARDGESVRASVVVASKRGDIWTKEETLNMVSDGPKAEFLLGDNQRLTIEGTSNSETVFDRAQSAAVQKLVVSEVEPLPIPVPDGDENATNP